MARPARMAKWLAFFSLVVGTILTGMHPANAGTVQTFVLSNVTFSDGSKAEGSLTYDVATRTLVSVSITAGGALYDNSHSAPVSVTSTGFSGSYDTQAASDTFQFVLDTPLTQTSGSTITLDPNLSTETIDTTPGGDGGSVTTLAVVSGGVYPLSALPSTVASLSGPSGKNGWYTGSVAVMLTPAAGALPVAATFYTLDGGPVQTYTGRFVIATETAHTLAFRSADINGNMEGLESIPVSVDGTPPVTSAYSPDGVALSYAATDNASGVAATLYTVDGGPTQRAAGGTISVAAYGPHTLLLWSVDVAGNVEAYHSYRVNTPPSVPGAPQLVSSTGTTVTLTWTTSQDAIGVAGYNLYRYFPARSGRGGGGARWGLAASTATNRITIPLTGAATFAVRAFDPLRNLSGLSAAATIQGDVKPTIYPTPTGQTTAGPYAILGGGFGQLVGIGATGFSPYALTISGYPAPTLTVVGPPGMTVNSATGIVSWTPAGNPGTYTATVQATNPAGTAVTTFTYTVCAKGTDLFAPTTPAAAPTFSNIGRTGVTVAWPGSTDNVAVAGYEIDFINFAYTPSTIIVKSPGTALTKAVAGLPVGSNWSVRVYAYDAAGNHSAGSPYGSIALLP